MENNEIMNEVIMTIMRAQGMVTNPMYTQKVAELEARLNEKGIEYKKITKCGGYVIIFTGLPVETEPDVALHDYSYGHENGLFEGYEFPYEKDPDEDYHDPVEGFLTIDEIMEKLDNIIKNSESKK